MQRVALIGGGGETQLVVIATAQCAVTRTVAAEQIAQRVRDRQRIGIDVCGQVAARGDVAQIGQQAIGDIHRCMREGTQAQAEGDARRRPQQAQAQAFVVGQQRGGGDAQRTLLPQAQRAGGITQRATDPDVIACLCAVAPQGLATPDLAHRGHRQRQRTARGVATDQRDVVLVGQGEEAIGEGLDPVFRRFRQ